MVALSVSGLLLGAPPRTVLHIGAGYGDDLAGYSGADVITLVEPNADMVAELRHKSSQLPNVTVIPAAVGSVAGKAQFNIYSIAELSSLQPAPGLSEVFRAARLVDRPEVEVITLSQAVAQHQTHKAGPNLLILDAPGVETELLSQLVRHDEIKRFDQIVIACANAGFYEGDKGRKPILPLLKPLFFELRSSTKDVWGRTLLRFEKSAEKLVEANNQKVAKSDAAIDRLTLRIDELERELTAANAQRRLYEQEISKLEVQLGLIREVMDSNAPTATEDGISDAKSG